MGPSGIQETAGTDLHVTSGHLAHPITSEAQGCNVCSSLPEEHWAGTIPDHICEQQQAKQLTGA